MQPPGKHVSYQPIQPSGLPETETGSTRASASAVNALLGRLGLARTQAEPGADEETLIANLSDPSWAVRVSAVQKLGKMGKQAPLGLLLAALRDEQSSVRVAAARSLGRNPRQAAISALVIALEDHEWLVRAEAALALGALHELAPLEALLAALQDKDATVRASAAKALGEISSAKALAPLNTALQDEDWSVREAATLALTQLNLEETPTISPLPDAQANGNYTAREVATTGLLHIFPYGAPAPLSLDDAPEQERERVEVLQGTWPASTSVTTHFPQSKTRQTTHQRARKKRGHGSGQAALKWPLKAMHTAEGVLAAVIITGLFVAWIALETQPHSTQGQANTNNSRSLTFTTYHGHESEVDRLAWSPDGQNIASADSVGDVRLWQASTGKTLADYPQYGRHVLALTWFDTSTVLVAYTELNRALLVVELPLSPDLSTPVIFQSTNLPGQPTLASWSADRQTLAFDTGDGSVQIWNVITDQLIAHFQEKHTQYAELSWSPDNDQLATLAITGLLDIWSVDTGQFVATLTSNHLATILVWISSGHYPSGRLLVDSNSTLLDWSYGRKPQKIAMFLAEQTYNFANTDGMIVTALSISPDKSQVLLATSDGVIQTRDLLSGSLIYLYTGHSEQVNDIEWSPNGQHIATASRDTTVRVWQEP